jgi:MEMO1 family protein
MTLSAGIFSPHPPLLIQRIGGRRLADLSATVEALNEARRTVDRLSPDLLIFISPHGPILDGCFALRTGTPLKGSFERFGFPNIRFAVDNDLEALAVIDDVCRDLGVPLSRLPVEGPGGQLDWGVMVPYHYLGGGRPVVALSPAHLTYELHYRFGAAVSRAADRLNKRAVFVASGDLSHRLNPEGPYGYSPRGLDFDQLVVDIVSAGRWADLLDIDPRLIEAAGECGLRSLITLAGAMSGQGQVVGTISYEAPFGVGYLVATMEPERGAARV